MTSFSECHKIEVKRSHKLNDSTFDSDWPFSQWRLRKVMWEGEVGYFLACLFVPLLMQDLFCLQYEFLSLLVSLHDFLLFFFTCLIFLGLSPAHHVNGPSVKWIYSSVI